MTTLKFDVIGKTYELPQKLKVGQFLIMDMQMVMKLQEGKIDFKDLTKAQEVVQWLVGFLKTLGTDAAEDDFDQLYGLMTHKQFQPWLTGLFGNLQPSKS